MRNKILTAALVAAVSLEMTALDEEFMVVTLKDGTTVEYNVEQIEKVAFDVRHTDEAFVVQPGNGDATAGYLTIPNLLRAQPAQTGEATMFGFGTVAATTAEELVAGDYGVQISVSAAKVYQGEIDLSSEKDSYTIKLVKYQDGGSEYILENVVSGTLNTKLNSKNQNVTIELDATFADGTVVTANYVGKPTNVESLAAMVPGINYGNEVFYYNTDGAETNLEIISASKSYSSYSKKTTLKFELDGYISGCETACVILTDDIMNSTETEFELATTVGWSFYLDGYSRLLQLSSPSGDESRDMYSAIIDNGKMRFVKNDDGTYELYMEFTNSYTSMGNKGGTPERIIFNYVGSF